MLGVEGWQHPSKLALKNPRKPPVTTGGVPHSSVGTCWKLLEICHLPDMAPNWCSHQQALTAGFNPSGEAGSRAELRRPTLSFNQAAAILNQKYGSVAVARPMFLKLYQQLPLYILETLISLEFFCMGLSFNRLCVDF